MDGNGDGDRDRVLGADNSAAEGDGDRGSRYGMARCASQSSLDESSQRPAAGGGAGGGGGGGEGGGAGEEATPQHACALLAALARLRGAGALCDVVLRAGGGEGVGVGVVEGAGVGAAVGPPIPAHRAVLAAASPYFLAMFTQFDERTQPEVTIQNIEPAALEAIVEYVYAPESLLITEDNVQALLAGASLVALGGVRAACCTFLRAALAADNALGIRAFADLHACADLRRHATHYVEAHFAQVLETEEFLALSADTLADLLDSDRIVVPDEEVVLEAALRWVQHRPAERGAALGALLEHVRLPLLAREALVALVARAGTAAGASEAATLRVKDLLIEALSFHLLGPGARALAAATNPRARPRTGARAPAVLLVAGGQAPKAIREVEVLSVESGRWRAGCALPSRRCRAGLAVVGGRAYAVGGFNGTLRVRSVDVLDVARGAWSAGPPLLARRSTLGVAALGGTLYAVGGFDGAAGLSSAEALEPGAGSWRPLAPMATRRSSVGVAVLEGRLYAVGGYDGAHRQCLHTVERYDPGADVWESVAEMSVRRSGCGVGVARGALYAVGGHDGPAVRRSVERYRPDPGGGTGAWSPAPHMHSARRNAAVAAHRDKLYVVGGDDGAANLDTVEVFDPGAEQWTLLAATMAVGRSYAAVAVLDGDLPPRSPSPPPATSATAVPVPTATTVPAVAPASPT